MKKKAKKPAKPPRVKRPIVIEDKPKEAPKATKSKEPGWAERAARGDVEYHEVPREERQRWNSLAAEWTAFNNAIAHAVWAGKEPDSALKFEDEGGKIKRVGWPDGYDPALAKELAINEHRTLLGKNGRGPTSYEAGVGGKRVRAAGGDAKAARGRPAGAVARGNQDFKGKKIILISKKNPKKEGTNAHAKWELYENGMTVEKYYDIGGKTSTLKWDTEHGFIKVE